MVPATVHKAPKFGGAKISPTPFSTDCDCAMSQVLGPKLKLLKSVDKTDPTKTFKEQLKKALIGVKKDPLNGLALAFTYAAAVPFGENIQASLTDLAFDPTKCPRTLTPTATATQTGTATRTAVPTSTPLPTATALPTVTDTAVPTQTPTPSGTSQPTGTTTATPEDDDDGAGVTGGARRLRQTGGARKLRQTDPTPELQALLSLSTSIMAGEPITAEFCAGECDVTPRDPLRTIAGVAQISNTPACDGVEACCMLRVSPFMHFVSCCIVLLSLVHCMYPSIAEALRDLLGYSLRNALCAPLCYRGCVAC